jgi:hypothetical protein
MPDLAGAFGAELVRIRTATPARGEGEEPDDDQRTHRGAHKAPPIEPAPIGPGRKASIFSHYRSIAVVSAADGAVLSPSAFYNAPPGDRRQVLRESLAGTAWRTEKRGFLDFRVMRELLTARYLRIEFVGCADAV